MRILVDINHPAHVHLFRNAIAIWESQGHAVMVLARDKDVTIDLLEHYGLAYILVSQRGKGLFGLAKELLVRTFKMIRLSLTFKPDVLISVASPAAAWTAAVIRKPHLAFDDTEAARLGKLLYLPFTHTVYTPDAFEKDLGPKQSRYAGYHELAYLHPNFFTPDEKIYKILGLEKGQPFYLVRLVHLGASHDLNAKGLQANQVEELLELLRPHGAVIISSEVDKTIRLDGTDQTISPAYMLDLLYFADIYIGEGGTTATESALLGTPAAFIYHFSGGNWSELENHYGLMKVCQSMPQVIQQVQAYLDTPDLKKAWQSKREQLLADKIDVTSFITEQVASVVERSE